MACLDNLVGIKSICTETESTSGLYIEDIGITAKECDMYVNAEYANGEAIITDKISFAGKLIQTLIRNHFSNHINTKSLIDSQTLGIFRDSLVWQPPVANNYGGINLRLQDSDSYLSIFVGSISLQVDVSQNVNVKVINLITGIVLDTIVVPCVANQISTKVVNKLYESERQNLDLIFVYDTTGINSNNTLLANFGIGGTGCAGCSGYRYSNSYIYSAPVYIPVASSQIRLNLSGGQHTFGMSLNYSIQCSTNKWLCDIANLMSLPILYKAGELIMDYATLYSDRQTSDVNIDAERNKERKLAYQASFNEAIEATVKKINLPKGDICFKCENFMQSAIILP